MPRTLVREQLCCAPDTPTSHKRIANNTLRVHYADGSYGIILHRTQILRRFPDGSFTITMDGWNTPTTRDRLNDALPPGFRVSTNRGQALINGQPFDPKLPLHVGPDGKLPPPADTSKIVALRKRISKFAAGLPDPLPVPDNGDCWYCLSNLPGEEHLISHMDEGYYPGSLLVNAMRHCGYSDQQIRLHYSLDIRERFKRSLVKYLKEKLG